MGRLVERYPGYASASFTSPPHFMLHLGDYGSQGTIVLTVRRAYGRFKIYIVDEVHMLTSEAFNALLKTLEEPPEHVKFIFATTEANKVPSTILSRCQRFDFKRIPLEQAIVHLKSICEQEHLKIKDEALFGIAKAAQGSQRGQDHQPRPRQHRSQRAAAGA